MLKCTILIHDKLHSKNRKSKEYPWKVTMKFGSNTRATFSILSFVTHFWTPGHYLNFLCDVILQKNPPGPHASLHRK